jgi:glycosyltransferase involved in cell wall biosynthesis
MAANPLKHIVFFTYVDITGSSGENVFSRELLRALARQPGVRLSVIAPQPQLPLPDDLNVPSVGIRTLPAKRRGSLAWALGIQGPTLIQLSRARRHFGRAAGHVVTLRPGTLVPSILSRILRVPQILVIEGLESSNVARMTRMPGAARLMTVVAWFNTINSKHVLVAYGAIRDWIGRLPHVDGSRIELFSHGVDPDKFSVWDRVDARRKLGLPYGPDDYVVGFVGSYKWYHSLDVLLDALARPEMSGIKVMLVGDGPEREAVTRRAECHGLQDRVLQTGLVPHDRIAMYIGACDLMFGARAPEHWSNPIKLIEYLAVGRPVIGFRTGEVAFIEEEGFGILLDEVTPASVAMATLRFRALDPQGRRNLGERGRRHVLDHRTWDALAKRMIQTLDG